MPEAGTFEIGNMLYESDREIDASENHMDWMQIPISTEKVKINKENNEQRRRQENSEERTRELTYYKPVTSVFILHGGNGSVFKIL